MYAKWSIIFSRENAKNVNYKAQDQANTPTTQDKTTKTHIATGKDIFTLWLLNLSLWLLFNMMPFSARYTFQVPLFVLGLFISVLLEFYTVRIALRI